MMWSWETTTYLTDRTIARMRREVKFVRRYWSRVTQPPKSKRVAGKLRGK